ncbi:MAG: hypothetical protein JRK53_17665 [Deltaproteobacteria bacterium]|nr:hypothetical protein [Deltaproteobacteria bacterium]
MLGDEKFLNEFEKGLNPQRLKDSPIPADIIGYGEISAIFRIHGHPDTAFKRLPLFSDRPAAEAYARLFHEYCGLLTDAGLCIPEQETFVIEAPGHPTTVYIAQQMLPSEKFAHRLIHESPMEDIAGLLDRIAADTAKIWDFNQTPGPGMELALDGQLSNLVLPQDQHGPDLFYIDTGTPLFRKQGVEQLDPELFLKSAPGFLRWILRLFFVDDVVNRYYDQRQVYIDLAANLYKEQRPDLIPLTVDVINRHLAEDSAPVTEDEIRNYYRTDRLIWTLFLAFRRVDRWLTMQVFRKRYEFILPGKIKR